jgi:hypothetical protein
MNPNLTEVSKPTQWKPGQSGNLNGRPAGTRQAFSAGFYRDDVIRRFDRAMGPGDGRAAAKVVIFNISRS